MFASQSWARIIHLQSKLSGTRKGNSTTFVAYYAKMKGFADEMAATSKCLDDEEVITYILRSSISSTTPLLTPSLPRPSLKRSMITIHIFSLQKHVLKLRRNNSRLALTLPFMVAGVVVTLCMAVAMVVLVVDFVASVAVAVVVDVAMATKFCAKCVARLATQHYTATSVSMQATMVMTSTPMLAPQATTSTPTSTPTWA
jgi:hypothetical protein